MTIKERIGVFGGTFDPPHIGHQILGMEATDELQLDQLYWVLAPQPPHKQGKKITPLDIRIEMVRAAIDEDRIFKFSSADIDRPGPHYVVDTMRAFRNQFPGAELSFIMGGDSLHDLPAWHAPQEFVDECDRLGVMHRPGERIDLAVIESEIPGISRKIHFIEAPLLEISSNQIRKLVSEKKPFRYYLPEAVYEIVLRNRLYLESEENHST
jgi:nicotinate-nucleotide adenylyltransferase